MLFNIYLKYIAISFQNFISHKLQSLLLGTNFKMFRSLDWSLIDRFTFLTGQSEHNLFSGLGLLVKHWFGLATVSSLFTIVTTFSLDVERGLSSSVLCDLVLFV